MLLVSVLILFLLALINYRIGGRGLFHPAVVFCLVWAINLFMIWLVGDFFYPITPASLIIFLGGAVTFSLGSAVAFAYPGSKPVKPPVQLSSRMVSIFLLALMIGTPLAIQWLLNQIAEHPSPTFFLSASMTMLDESVQKTLGYTFFANAVAFANLITLITFYGQERYKKRWLTILLLTLFLNVLTAGRSGIVVLILGVFWLDWVKNRRIRWKLLTALGLLLFVLAGALAIYLGKAEADPNASVVENAVPVAQGLVMYAAGGIVAFDRVVQDPGLQPRDFQIGEFFVRTLNKFGADMELPNTSSGFIAIGPRGLIINVYTIYYTYADLGYFGMMAMMAVLGIGVTACYKSSLLGNRVAGLMYAALFAGLVLSPFAEFFFHNLNSLLKLYALSWLVYSLPHVWPAWRKFVSHSVRTELAYRRT